MRCQRLVFLAVMLVSPVARAQGHQHGGAPPEVSKAGEMATMEMPMKGPLGIPAARDGSGTAWLPDATEMRGLHASAAGFHLMFHYSVFGGFDYQGSDGGDSAPISTNWFMGMAHRDVLGGQPWPGRC